MKTIPTAFTVLTFCLMTLGVQTASAATISFMGRTDLGVTDQEYNLTTLGTSDWAYWNSSLDPASGAAANDMIGGSGIGTISGTGGTSSVRGTGTPNTTVDFTFTNGSSTASGSANNVTGLFNSDLSATGFGVQLDFTLADPSKKYTINVWTAGFATQFATVVGSLSGATSYNSGALSGTGGSSYYGDYNAPKEQYLYTFDVIADNPNDVFNFTINTSGTTGSSRHVLISGASLSSVAIPEPSSFALLSGALVLGFAMLRRR